ncbi:NFX1-type zinc finger-containing protein 1-like [Haliotis asinina]|uniref:NFX1-type zinc finger-containing protein 1-like n=1 Tax=Haliotis asinina TaxID=109174 RepID=UPI003531C311
MEVTGDKTIEDRSLDHPVKEKVYEMEKGPKGNNSKSYEESGSYDDVYSKKDIVTSEEEELEEGELDERELHSPQNVQSSHNSFHSQVVFPGREPKYLKQYTERSQSHKRSRGKSDRRARLQENVRTISSERAIPSVAFSNGSQEHWQSQGRSRSREKTRRQGGLSHQHHHDQCHHGENRSISQGRDEHQIRDRIISTGRSRMSKSAYSSTGYSNKSEEHKQIRGRSRSRSLIRNREGTYQSDRDRIFSPDRDCALGRSFENDKYHDGTVNRPYRSSERCRGKPSEIQDPRCSTTRYQNSRSEHAQGHQEGSRGIKRSHPDSAWEPQCEKQYKGTTQTNIEDPHMKKRQPNHGLLRTLLFQSKPFPEPNVIASTLASQSDKLETYLCTNEICPQIFRLISVLEKCSRATICRENKLKVMYLLRTRKFFERKDIIDKLKDPESSPDKDAYLVFLKELLTLMKAMIHEVKVEKKDIQICKSLIESSPEIEDEKGEGLKKLLDDISELYKKQQVITIASNALDEYPVINQPILPSIDVIKKGDKTSIPKHNTLEPFPSELHYVAHMYAIFREDFVQPLVSGIRMYISHLEKHSTHRFRNTDVKLYENVRVISATTQTDNGMVWTIRFKSNFRKGSYIPTVLRYGTLLCLSHDGFQSIHYATVANRNASKLVNGQIDIKFVEDSDLSHLLEVTFVMLECKAFYEAYSHSLASLKILANDLRSNKKVLPLGKYLTGQSRNVSYPSYLDACGDVSFKCLKLYGNRNMKQQTSYTTQVRNLESWPCCEEIGLDASQLLALKLALNNEIALIQGPPGTGKTMMGIRIAELLLHNKVMWQRQMPYNLPFYELMHHDDASGPLLLVSYTNHALDQFLQLLLKSPVMTSCQDRDIIRVGSRCEVEELSRFALKKHRRSQSSCEYKRSFGVLKDIEKRIDVLNDILSLYQSTLIHEDSFMECGILSSFHHSQFKPWMYYWEGRPNNNSMLWSWLDLPDSVLYTQCTAEWSNFQEEFVQEEDIRNEDHWRIIDDEDDDDDDDFSFVHRHTFLLFPSPTIALDSVQLESDQYFSHLSENDREQIMTGIRERLALPDSMTRQFAETIDDIWDLDITNRWRLYKHWVCQATHQLTEKLRLGKQEYESASRRYCETRSLLDSRIMKEASLVAMTTTAAARYTSTLKEVGAPVVIIEEAAQVSEQHVLGALSPACQHLIMIGDHQQLRPAFNDYSLAKSHHTDVSLFERLVRSGIAYQQLENQHRMRPEMSQLLVPHIYKTLKDDDSVFSYPDVRGMASNVYFLTHEIEEDHDDESLSHKNRYEADFLTKLYRHLRLQGYHSSEITVLALYNDQVQALRKRIRETETDVLLLHTREVEQLNSEIKPTLGRSRQANVRITSVDNFQGEENKIILLSLVRSNKSGRIGHLSAANRVCVALSRAKEGLYVIGNMECLRKASSLWDKVVTKAEEKGMCGNVMKLKCSKHPERMMGVKTAKDFDQYSDGGCSQACNARLGCGHTCSRRCHTDDPEHARKCVKVVVKLCKMGHSQEKKCSEKIAKCEKDIEVQLPKCGHTTMMPCFKDINDVQCEERCTEKISCGHVCQRRCGEVCNTAADCNELVKKTGKCGHSCQVACSQTIVCKIRCDDQLDCGHQCMGTCGACHQGRLHQPCRKKCERKLICGHLCGAFCTEVCPPCRRQCEQKCNHSECCDKCGDICVLCVEPCRWRCRKDCDNKFACTKLCSEDCDRDRCDMPCPRTMPCGHKCKALNCEKCFCRECTDKTEFEIFFGTEDEPDAVFYKLPGCKHIFEVTSLDTYMDNASESIGMKTCPKCTSPIMTSKRYGNCIRRCQREIDEVKGKLFSQPGEMKREKDRLIGELSKIDNEKQKDIFKKQLLSTKSTDSIACLSNQIGFYLNVRSTEDNLDNVMPGAIDVDAVQDIRDELSCLMKWVLVKRVRFSDQELSEFKMELTRIRLGYRYLLMQHNLSTIHISEEKRKRVGESTKRLRSGDKLLEADVEVLQEELKKLEAEHPQRGLGITDDERIMILKAMGFNQKGHWYKCKRGHVYAIGECGGAMQEGKCPECSETIGGSRHQLREDNSLATEMDGAQFSAWSDQANMANYDFN